MILRILHTAGCTLLLSTVLLLTSCDTESPWADPSPKSTSSAEKQSVSGSFIGSLTYVSGNESLNSQYTHTEDYSTRISEQSDFNTLIFDQSKLPKLPNLQFALKNSNGTIKLVELLENDHYTLDPYTSSEFHLNLNGDQKSIIYLISLVGKDQSEPHKLHVYGQMFVE